MERTSRHSVPSTATGRTMDRPPTRHDTPAVSTPPVSPAPPRQLPRSTPRRRPSVRSRGGSPSIPVAVAATWGVTTTVLGGAVLVRAWEADWSDDVIELAGTTHTARLGVIEVCFGTVMLLAAATRSRVVLGAMAAALAVTGGFMLLERRRVAEELAIGTVDAWLVIGAAAVLATSLVYTGSRRP